MDTPWRGTSWGGAVAIASFNTLPAEKILSKNPTPLNPCILLLRKSRKGRLLLHFRGFLSSEVKGAANHLGQARRPSNVGARQ